MTDAKPLDQSLPQAQNPSGSLMSEAPTVASPDSPAGMTPETNRTVEKKAQEEHDLCPRDSYTPNGVYWADLPLRERYKFIFAVDRAEWRREGAAISKMYCASRWEPFRAYWRTYCLSGFGMFVEGFTLFSIGNIYSLFSATWPDCWEQHTVCAAEAVYAVDELEILGIMAGQVLVGIECDWIGTSAGAAQDAAVMLLGTLLLIGAWGTSLQGWVACYAVALFVYGIGAGGEFPVMSTRALEAAKGAESRLHRGRRVQLSFLMQGWGQLFNQVVLIVLLLAFKRGRGGPPYDETSTQWTYRLSFAAVLPFTAYVLWRRVRALRRTRAAGVSERGAGYDVRALRMVVRHYWPRLLATMGGWFLMDFVYYGNKIFQAQFIATIAPGNTSVLTAWLYNLLNIGVSMLGYYAAAALVDARWYGRRRMQTVGFAAVGLIFLLCAVLYNDLVQPGAGTKAFQALYYVAGFFIQFGPNATTFIVAAECYPSAVRSTAHGLSAAAGKIGALVPTIVFNHVSPRTRFWCAGPLALAGALLSWACLPDLTGLDLAEQERYWAAVVAGREAEYDGPAVAPAHLSRWERWVMRRGRTYKGRSREGTRRATGEKEA